MLPFCLEQPRVAATEMTTSHRAASTSLEEVDAKEDNVGPAAGDNTSRSGLEDFEDERTQARLLLSPDEEKKLLRRIDWHLMPLCSLIFMFKNLDSNNVSPEEEKLMAPFQRQSPQVSSR